ncbi:MAG TPA: hypothetical protein VGM91_07440 [Conexibacter sp.]|jgi:hypothetical protein
MSGTHTIKRRVLLSQEHVAVPGIDVEPRRQQVQQIACLDIHTPRVQQLPQAHRAVDGGLTAGTLLLLGRGAGNCNAQIGVLVAGKQAPGWAVSTIRSTSHAVVDRVKLPVVRPVRRARF